MKKLSLILAALLMAIAAQAQSDLIARIHFLGGDKISADTNSAAFANEFNSPQAQALENQTLDKLAKIFVAKLKPNAGAEDLAQLRPLLDDLLKSEWILEIRGATNGVPEYTLAVRLSSERANLWSKNLHAPLENWVSMEVPQSATGVMWIKKFDPSYWCLFGRSSGYTIVDFGQGNLHEGILRFAESKFTDTGTNWLSADLNWPRLAQLFPALREFDFPKIAFQVIGHNGYFRFNGKLNLSQPLPSLEAWRVPTNSIHQPFISFTAARGVAPWLAKQSWFAPYKLSPQPNQFFTWSMPGIAFQTYAAEPVPNANAALTQLYENLSANGNWRSNFSTPLKLSLTNNQLNISGIPFAAPNIRVAHEANGDFLVGGFFPNTPRGKPLPPELFEQLATPNLVYYHWEITEERLRVMPQLSQLMLMATKHEQLNGQSLASKWLMQIAPKLTNSVTIATEISPTEISFTRKSAAGLDAVELRGLASWLESPKFPAFDLRSPPRVMRPRSPQQFPLMSALKPAPAPAK